MRASKSRWKLSVWRRATTTKVWLPLKDLRSYTYIHYNMKRPKKPRDVVNSGPNGWRGRILREVCHTSRGDIFNENWVALEKDRWLWWVAIITTVSQPSTKSADLRSCLNERGWGGMPSCLYTKYGVVGRIFSTPNARHQNLCISVEVR
jgi:hypothetical protein